MKKHRRIHNHHSLIQKLATVILLAGSLLILSSCRSFAESAQTPSPESIASYTEVPDTISEDVLEVHVLDVGQGLSVFIRSGDACLLYDGGREAASSFVVSYLKRHDIEKLDYVIASHYDSDHLSGIVGVVNVFPIETLIVPDYKTDTPVYDSFIAAVSEKQLSITYPVPNEEYPLGDGTFKILAPLGTGYADENDYSVVVMISIGGKSLLLTGDASLTSEQEMLTLCTDLNSDVLVIGHHGSAGSTQEEFFNAVSPEYAVISCGLGNDYGHPSERVTTLLEKNGTLLYRTDVQGTIDFVMNANDITFSESPCNNYTSGKDLALDEKDFHADDYIYILNTRTHKFHLPDCDSVAQISVRNRRGTNKSREELLQDGYDPCGSCKP